MTHYDLLDAVQPADGWFAITGIKGLSVKQELVPTREEANALIQRFVAQERNVYFGVAKYATGEDRKKTNVSALKALWLDIDCGSDKAAVNPKSGKPKGYADQTDAMQALRRFCALVGLPKPTVVDSGRGLHIYWVLTQPVSREHWEQAAARLRELCIEHDLYVDPAVFEVARILRVPGTLNFKDSPPSPVSVVVEGQETDFLDILSLLGVEVASDSEPTDEQVHAATEVAPKRPLTALGQSMVDNMVSKFSKIMMRSANGDGCAQLLDCYQNRQTLDEPRWFDAISIASFCEDRDAAIHKISQDHAGYTYAGTEEKTKHIVGPHTCEVFERNNPGGCAGCPFQGKIKSPIVLGRDIAAASAEDNVVTVEGEDGEEDETFTIPEYPDPFFRGRNGGIYRKPLTEETDPIWVYEHDLYVVKRMYEPGVGEVVVMRLHLPKDGVKEFIVSNAQISEKGELRKALASQGVICGEKRFAHLTDFIFTSIRELQYKRKAELMRLQFGWAEKNSKFIIGDREISRDGIFHSPPSSATGPMVPHMGAMGSLERWKEVFALYGKPGLEPHAFAALTAFGAPLLKFLGQSGAIINVIHPHSGTGKTTILHMCNSVYGHPKHLCAVKEDTANAKTMHLGLMNNLPFTVDEITNMSPSMFSELVYNMSQGRGKNRMKSSGNELRLNATTWQTISLCSSNASFYEKLASLKNSPEGEMMRLLEYKIDYVDAIDVAEAKHMFDHQLMENYGHAGDIYASWLVGNAEEAKNTALSIQAKIDRELKLTQRERFWSAVVAANIAGGLIAKQLGLITWDMKAVYKSITDIIRSMRVEVKPPSDDVTVVLGDYINRHMQNILVVKEAVDMRTKMPTMPTMEPRGELLIRFEPDTTKMFISARSFKNDCVLSQVNYRETLKQLEEKGIYVGTELKRLSKGMKFTAPPVRSLVFDCSNSDFLHLDVPSEAADAGGGS